MKRVRTLLCVVSLLFGPMACGRGNDAAAPPKKSCSQVVWHRPARDDATVEIATSWEGFVPRPTQRAADGYRVARIEPPPGEQTYAFVEDGVFRVDEHVGTSAFVRTGTTAWSEVTLIHVGRCELPEVRVVRTIGNDGGVSRVTASFVAGANGDPLDPGSIRFTLREGTTVGGAMTVADSSIDLRTTLPIGKHRLTLHARDARGREAPPVHATVWVEPPAFASFDWRDALIYQVVVDRYATRAGLPPAKPSTPSARAGGHIEGVRKAIESGELEALGVRAIWLSPLYDNPEGTWSGADSRPYSSYHGYWPVAPRALEPAVADEASLDGLIAAAHARGMRVIFDVVPNHVHQDHPYVAAHGKEGWFNGVGDGKGCVCGAAGCSFATSALTCWFTPYLPDVDWRSADAARQMTDDVAWFIDRFDGDGVRIDAVPLMPRAAVRRIAATIRARFDHPGHRSLVLGEVFTGAEGHAELRWYLGPFGLDSAFDFPLMWSLRETIAEGKKTLRALETTIRASELAWEGSGAVMSPFIGNHDVPRFASVSNGDAGRDGWDEAPQPTDESVYGKQRMALAIALTLPGAPTLYYGDELALAGGGDPDSRRVMPSEPTSAQRALRDDVRVIGRARTCAPALRRGSYRTIYVDDEALVFARELAGEETAWLVVARKGEVALPRSLPGLPAGAWVDVVSKQPLAERIDGGPRSVRLYLPKGSRCL